MVEKEKVGMGCEKVWVRGEKTRVVGCRGREKMVGVVGWGDMKGGKGEMVTGWW
ncbi:hypothetical protein [Kocuria salsicia]|uniref:hypothetical protein n=1 Tax=Kocuria salsicia TaxID=664639 RepID=UPI001643D9C4|nr:hypothetical protein [Kocuria salsicia]